jgi:succinate dehydrogenase membrane anchor subunit
VVINVTSFGRSGLSDFVVQRVSAVVIAVYAFCVAGFFVAHPHPQRAALVGFFSGVAMQMFSTLALLATAAHAWIGMWTIGTDYVRPHYFGTHATVYRISYQFGCLLLLFVYVLWGLQIFWRS